MFQKLHFNYIIYTIIIIKIFIIHNYKERLSINGIFLRLLTVTL